MRNLAEYPVTRGEMLEAVAKALRDYDASSEVVCGDIHGVALRAALAALCSLAPEAPAHD
jgi:hypothetical protein